ncbi:hypothetical protein VTK73DRAFT_10143 [Phialemonium thermophilum]|uniref:Aminoglycoside phosphotransferase domain-containing protein n=1 Tax=Phialemonium thermophilum TaxID=223376 RepID=A0ABR3VYE8_9PEZI
METDMKRTSVKTDPYPSRSSRRRNGSLPGARVALWTCDWDECENPAARRTGDCMLCDRHLCRLHLREPWHRCPKPEENWEAYSQLFAAAEARYVDDLCRRIDTPKLCSIASELRGGVPCTVEWTRAALSAMMGNQNCHAEIAFDDGVRWIARFRLVKVSSPPPEVRRRILRSEVATMTFLRRHTRVPVPQIFGWACECDPANVLGVSYILMEKLTGKPLDWEEASSAEREKIIKQLAEIFLELEKHPFSSTGSLDFSAAGSADFEVRGYAHHALFPSRCGDPLGPFPSWRQACEATTHFYISMIASGEVDAYSPVDAFLAHRFRLDILDEMDICSPSRFYLKHPDDKGDHILVNDSYDIIGIIDWEWARIVSKEEAFSSPCLMWPVGEFYDGLNDLCPEELQLAKVFSQRGRQDLADCVLHGRKIQRFLFCMGPDVSVLDKKTFTDLFMGMERLFSSGKEAWEQWRIFALEKWKDDETLRILVEKGQMEDRRNQPS